MKEVSNSSRTFLRMNHLAMVILFSLALLVCWSPVRAAVDLGLHDDRYIQVITAPFLCVFLVFWERDRIFSQPAWAPVPGISLLTCALAFELIFLRRNDSAGRNGVIAEVVIFVVAVMAAFIACYGMKSFRAAWFSMACLFLMIPVPAAWIDQLASGLQQASASLTVGLLRIAGTPVFAQGTKLILPGLPIEVAPECSGIRSCLTLALTGIVASRIFLRNGWHRLLFLLMMIPVALIKNAVRISVIASLSLYVDRGIIYGPIHHYGGMIFAPVSFGLFLLILIGLNKFEKRMEVREA